MHPDVKPRFVNALLQGNALTLNTTWWLALHSTSLSTAALPTTVTEIARTNNYSRISVTTAMWSSATTAVAGKNSTGLQWPDPTSGWGQISAVSMHDSSVTSGAGASTCWFFQNLATTVSASAGNPVRLSSGTLTFYFE